MTSKERVMRTFNHQKPDRVPIDYSSNPEIDRKLKKHFGLDEHDYEGLLKKLKVDFRAIQTPYIGEYFFKPDEIDIEKGYQVDPVWGVRTRWVEHSAGGYQDFCRFILKGASLEDVKKLKFPSPDDYDYSTVEAQCDYYKDYAIYIGNPGLGDNMNQAGMLFSQEEVYAGLILEDEALLYHMDKRNEIMLEVTRRTLEAANGKIDFMWLGEDLGTQRYPIISLDLFREQIRPRLQAYVDLAKEYNIPVMIHSCGSSSAFFEDFLEMGITAVDTLQPEAHNMSPEYLVENYNGKMMFHGCLSTTGNLAFGSPEDVERDCKHILDVMMPTYSYCYSPTHMIQDNSPLENVLKLYEVGQTYGVYK